MNPVAQSVVIRSGRAVSPTPRAPVKQTWPVTPSPSPPAGVETHGAGTALDMKPSPMSTRRANVAILSYRYIDVWVIIPTTMRTSV